MSYSSSKTKHSVQQMSLSMDSVMPDEVTTEQTGTQFGSGRPMDLKLRSSRAQSSDAMTSKSTVTSVCTNRLIVTFCTFS